MAYQGADYDTAARWVAQAGDASALATWIRAKLLMRAGRIDEAIAALAAAAKQMPADELWPQSNWYDRVGGWSSQGPLRPHDEMLAEMGALHLTRGNYVESLTLLLDSGRYWTDAAYIADQVLTLDELRRFVDSRRPAADRRSSRDGEAISPAEQHDALRSLLARRLTRNGRWKEARDYFDPEHRELLDAYIASIRAGHDKSLPRADRAAAFVGAARMAREHGIVLLATELDPDHASHGGRFGADDPKPPSDRVDLPGPALKPTADELRRVVEHRPTPMRRWHYRYTAADHAWSAADLMDDGTDELAAWLQEAGMWLAAKDPDAADRFYKALVRRCGNTALGKEADRLRWFPAAKNQE
jgi:tetratricopeptide (TPR) repeat protein